MALPPDRLPTMRDIGMDTLPPIGYMALQAIASLSTTTEYRDMVMDDIWEHVRERAAQLPGYKEHYVDDRPAEPPMPPQLVLLVGLPFSGKSTYAAKLRERDGFTVICPDEIRLALHGREFYPPAEGIVWGMAETVTRSLLAQGHKIIIDAVNNTLERRSKWYRLGEEYGANTGTVLIDTPAEVCRQRAMEAGKPHMEDVIARMSTYWEPVSGDMEETLAIIHGEES
jgi:predicted kinase